MIALCEKERDPPLQQIVVDTPGQIEIFTWSASGAIITEVGTFCIQHTFSPMLSSPDNVRPEVSPHVVEDESRFTSDNRVLLRCGRPSPTAASPRAWRSYWTRHGARTRRPS